MKVSSTRLKPEEASAILQENGDEARVGCLSVQIMANISDQQQQRQQSEAQDVAAAPTQSATVKGTVATAGKAGTSSRAVGLAARGSGLGRRSLRASIKLGSAGRALPHTAGPLASIASSGSTGGSGSIGSSGSNAEVAGASAAATRPPPSAAPGALKRTGLGGSGRGSGGARRFHAPRLSSSAAAVAARGGGKSTGRPSAPPGAGSPSLTAANCGVAVSSAATAGAKVAAERSFENRRSGGVASTAATAAAAAAADPEGLVLEWTAGNPPQPVMAGASLARRLHPHQREGLKVLWECLAGRGG